MPTDDSIPVEQKLDVEELIALSKQTLKRIDALLKYLKKYTEPDHDVNGPDHDVNERGDASQK